MNDRYEYAPVIRNYTGQSQRGLPGLFGYRTRPSNTMIAQPHGHTCSRRVNTSTKVVLRPPRATPCSIASDDLPELVESGRDVALVAVIGRFVVTDVAELVRQVLLGDDTDGMIVRVAIPLAVTEAFGP